MCLYPCTSSSPLGLVPTRDWTNLRSAIWMLRHLADATGTRRSSIWDTAVQRWRRRRKRRARPACPSSVGSAAGAGERVGVPFGVPSEDRLAAGRPVVEAGDRSLRYGRGECQRRPARRAGEQHRCQAPMHTGDRQPARGCYSAQRGACRVPPAGETQPSQVRPRARRLSTCRGRPRGSAVETIALSAYARE